jgi:hypothetical protein
VADEEQNEYLETSQEMRWAQHGEEHDATIFSLLLNHDGDEHCKGGSGEVESRTEQKIWKRRGKKTKADARVGCVMRAPP